MRKIIALCILLFFASYFKSQENRKEENLFSLLVKDISFDEMVDYLSIKINKFKNDDELYYTRAYSYYRIGDLDSAQKDIKKALDLEPKSLLALYVSSEIENALKNYNQSNRQMLAIYDMDKARAIQMADALRERLMVEKDKFAIFRYLERISILKPTVGNLLNLTDYQLANNQRQNAVDNMRKAIKIATTDEEKESVYRTLLYICDSCSYDEKFEMLKKILAYNPNYVLLDYFSQEIKVKGADKRKLLDQWKALRPDDSLFLLFDGIYYFEQKNYEKAIENFNKGAKLTSTNHYLYYYLGESYHQQAHASKNPALYENAVDAFTAALKINKNHAESYEIRTEVRMHIFELDYDKNKRPNQALGKELIEDYNYLIDKKLHNDKSYYNRALVKYALNNNKMSEDIKKDIELSKSFDNDDWD